MKPMDQVPVASHRVRAQARFHRGDGRQYSLGSRIVVAARLPASLTASVMTHSFSPFDVR
jgi:hypothetical protein